MKTKKNKEEKTMEGNPFYVDPEITKKNKLREDLLELMNQLIRDSIGLLISPMSYKKVEVWENINKLQTLCSVFEYLKND